MKINPLYFLISLLLFSCTKRESQEEFKELMIDAYDYRYMDYYASILANYNASDNLVWLEYNTSNKLTKRLGGLGRITAASGYDYQMTSDIFEEITYSNNEIYVETINNHDNFSSPYTREFILENNKISRMIVTDIAAQSKDTVYYTYNSIGLLSKSVDLKYSQTYPYREITSNFYFNQNQNLDSIISTHVSS